MQPNTSLADGGKIVYGSAPEQQEKDQDAYANGNSMDSHYATSNEKQIEILKNDSGNNIAIHREINNNEGVVISSPSPNNSKNDPLLLKSGDAKNSRNLTQKDLSMMSNINAYVYPDKVYREVIIVTIAVFMGYASLVVVQVELFIFLFIFSDFF